jgi:hypothetical protein
MKRANIGWFATNVLGRKLYGYQEEIGNAILDSVLNNKGLTITCMLARQMGKNELSACVEAYLLCCMEVAASESCPNISSLKLLIAACVCFSCLRMILQRIGYGAVMAMWSV